METTKKVHGTDKNRDKLKALEHKHRATGKITRTDKLVRNSLGTKNAQPAYYDTITTTHGSLQGGSCRN